MARIISHTRQRTQAFKKADTSKRKAKSTKALYDSKRWKDTRARVLDSEPLCRICRREGRITEATVVDHIKPHRGDLDLFWDDDNHQPLCKPCHDRKTSEETRSAASAPSDLKPARARVVLVCGPPGSGRLEYVRAHASKHDRLFDEEAEAARMDGVERYHAGDQARKVAEGMRNSFCKSLSSSKDTTGTAWVIMQCPRAQEREQWETLLGAEVVVVEADAHEVLMRTGSERAEALAKRWIQRYSSRTGEMVVQV